MKTQIRSIALALLVSGPSPGLAQNSLTNDPAFLPIDKFLDVTIARPQVNINLPRFLLQDALSEFDGSTNDPLAATGINFADVIKDVKLIRVMVIEADQKSRSHVDQAVKSLRKELETKWTSVVSVPEDNVGIYAVSDAAGDRMAGLAVLVQDDEDVVIGNVVGRISIGKLVKIAGQIDAIPPEVMESLSGMSAEGRKDSNAEEPAKGAKSDKAER